jgi:hypothetical protein
MSKSEILDELRKLTPEERQQVRLRLAALDNDDSTTGLMTGR